MNYCDHIRSIGITNLINPDTSKYTIKVEERKTGQKIIIQFDETYDVVGFVVEHHDFKNEIKLDPLMKKGCEAALFFFNKTSKKNTLILCELKTGQNKKALEQIKGGFLATQYIASFASLSACLEKNKLNHGVVEAFGLIATQRKTSSLKGTTSRHGDIVYLHGPSYIALQKIIA